MKKEGEAEEKERGDEERQSGRKREKTERGRSGAEWRRLGSGTGRCKWQCDPQHTPSLHCIARSCARHLPCTRPWAPLRVSTLLCALQGRCRLQAGWALRGRVPQLREGVNTCGDNAGGESKAGWKVPATVRPTPWGPPFL